MEQTLRRAMSENNVDFWETLISGAAGAKVADIVWNFAKEKWKRKSAASDSIKKTVQIYTALQSIPYHQCKRRNVFKAHNGGKILDTRTHKYVSLLYEDFKPPFESAIDDIQNWRMDDSYAKLLADVTKNKVVPIHVDSMVEGRLKDVYMAQKVRYSCVYYIGEDGYNLYYASFATDEEMEDFDRTTRSAILNSLDKISKLLNF